MQAQKNHTAKNRLSLSIKTFLVLVRHFHKKAICFSVFCNIQEQKISRVPIGWNSPEIAQMRLKKILEYCQKRIKKSLTKAAKSINFPRSGTVRKDDVFFRIFQSKLRKRAKKTQTHARITKNSFRQQNF